MSEPNSERTPEDKYADWSEAMSREDKRLRKMAKAEIERRLRARDRVPLKSILKKYSPEK
jgi:hypothetical protein